MEVPVDGKIRSLSVLKIGAALAVLVICGFGVTAAHEAGHGDGDSSHYQCNHGHSHHHHHRHHHNHDKGEHGHGEVTTRRRSMLPEELAEEEDLKLLRFGGGDHHHHDDHYHGAVADAELSGLVQGKPSKAVVDSLALFGAGAMLGDAFLHQLPHAFGGEHSHSHDHDLDHSHLHDHSGHEHFQSHAHSLEDLSVGLSILGGIILFLLVEKLVRYVEDSSGEASGLSHGHHHHHKKSIKLKTENDAHDNLQGSTDDKHEISADVSNEKVDDGASVLNEENHPATLRKRNTGEGAPEDQSSSVVTENGIVTNGFKSNSDMKEDAKSSNLVFGYLNLFSDGVHNFTDGMALGSAFLLYGSIGGWSRTLFLLAHEIPQEIGDFGILVRSGFSVSEALFFNFLSALVALAGTTLALMWGQDAGHSSLIEGFTAGGFIYISVAGVLAEMNSGRSTLKSGAIQLLSLVAGMAVALCISLLE